MKKTKLLIPGDKIIKQKIAERHYIKETPLIDCPKCSGWYKGEKGLRTHLRTTHSLNYSEMDALLTEDFLKSRKVF